MTAIEILERAISRLEELKAEATGGMWSAETYLYGTIDNRLRIDSSSLSDDDLNLAEDVRAADAALIVALSRTVEPMLALLRKGRASMRGTEALGNPHPHTPLQKHALATAHAILGEENDHDR